MAPIVGCAGTVLTDLPKSKHLSLTADTAEPGKAGNQHSPLRAFRQSQNIDPEHLRKSKSAKMYLLAISYFSLKVILRTQPF